MQNEYKKELERLIQQNRAYKLQRELGITREEVTLNKKLVEGMLMKETTPLLS